MSSALTHEQCELLRQIGAGRKKFAASRLFNLQLLQRTGLIVEDSATKQLRITEAGKRYVAFIERTKAAPGQSGAVPGRCSGSPSSFEAEPQ